MKVRLTPKAVAFAYRGRLIKHSNPEFEVDPAEAEKFVKRGIVEIVGEPEEAKAKPAAKKEAEEPAAVEEELESKTLKELQAIAKERGISSRGLSKAALLEKLQAAEAAEQPALDATESVD